MLRSLVGSEMCIRDSVGADRASGDMGERLLSGQAPGRDRRLAGRRHTPCLLYTSDAADELLCVDLGGRRIINNKNTKLNRYDTHRHMTHRLIT